MALGNSSSQALSPTIPSIGNGPTYFGFEGASLSLELEIPGRQQNPIFSLHFDCPLVLVSCGFALGLSLLRLLPYSLLYCLHLCGSWHCSSGEVQVHRELQLSPNHHMVWAFLSPRLWATVIHHL